MHLASELDVSARVVNSLRTLEHLHHSLRPFYIQHLPAKIRMCVQKDKW
jgi:hypothetical protein